MKVPEVLKKALSKSFNAQKPRRTLALTLLLTTAAAGGAHMALTETPSGMRTPILGEQQYNRLRNDIDVLAVLKAEIVTANKAAAALQQQVLAVPEKKEIESRMWEIRSRRSDIERRYDQQREQFKENLLASEGISEKDAIMLVEAFEKKVDTETFKPINSGNRLAHLDECQADPKTQDNPYNMPWCLSDAGEVPGTQFGMLGAGLLAAFMASGLASAGARFEKELKEGDRKQVSKNDKKKKNFTININVRND